MTTINNNTPVGGLNLTKRVGAGSEQTAGAAKTPTGGFTNDNLVRSGGTANATGSAGAAGAKALDELAGLYDADPAQFAYNVAEKALGEVASLVG